MSAEPTRWYTLEEYFELERRSDQRFEFVNGQIFAMSGAQPNHNRVTRNMIRRLANQLEGKTCEVFGSDQRVKVLVASPYLYPDVSIACPKPEFESINGLLALTNPTVLVEVLSPTTRHDDLKAKFIMYQTIPSLLEYVVVEPDKIKVVHFRKQADENWEPELLESLTDILTLTSINCKLSLTNIYQSVEFSTNSTE
ncbi:MAG: Uma2 family endonuclease [Acidobacteria bacterium]|nr:Uma2 family endonuclease [Acidobacteriota bacterium]